MKLKSIAIMLAAVITAILCICICGCADGNDSETAPSDVTTTTTTTTVTTTSYNPESHNVPTTTHTTLLHNVPTTLPTEPRPTTTAPFYVPEYNSRPVVVEESREKRGQYVIIDNAGCTLTLKAIKPDGYKDHDGYSLVFELVNKSGKAITAYPVFTTINGWQINAGNAGDNTAGPHETVEYVVLCGDLSRSMYGDYTTVDEIRFNVFYASGGDIFASNNLGTYAVYPTGKTPEEITYASIKKESREFYDVYVTELSALAKGVYDYNTMVVLLENRTDNIIDCTFSDLSINDIIVTDGHYSVRLGPRCCYVLHMQFAKANPDALPAFFSCWMNAEMIPPNKPFSGNPERVVRYEGVNFNLTEDNCHKLDGMYD